MIIRFWRSSGYFQMRVFDLPQLRHTIFSGSTLLETLRNLSRVSVTILLPLLGKVPNLKKLGMDGRDISEETPINLDLKCFLKLEAFKVERNYYLNFSFSYSLKKLTIDETKKLGTYMSTIGTLPNLQLLRLVHCKFESGVWEPSEGEFCKLEYLLLDASDL